MDPDEILFQLTGLRGDGRLPHEGRITRASMSFNPAADGSAMFEMGNTKVSCVMTGPREVRGISTSSGGGGGGVGGITNNNIAVQLSYAPFSSTAGPGTLRRLPARKLNEIAGQIASALNSVVRPINRSSGIKIQLLVLSSDGGIQACCLNASVMAMIDGGVPMKDFLVGMSVCVSHGGEMLVDPNFKESARADSEIFTAMFARSRTFAVSSLRGRVSPDRLGELLRASQLASTALFPVMETIAKSVMVGSEEGGGRKTAPSSSSRDEEEAEEENDEDDDGFDASEEVFL